MHLVIQFHRWNLSVLNVDTLKIMKYAKCMIALLLFHRFYYLIIEKNENFLVLLHHLNVRTFIRFVLLNTCFVT